jgi:hypothetical protein
LHRLSVLLDQAAARAESSSQGNALLRTVANKRERRSRSRMEIPARDTYDM